MITPKAAKGLRDGVVVLIALALALAFVAAPAKAQDSEPPPPDTAPPTVGAVSPADGATTVHPADNVTATFSEPMDPATVDATTFTLTKEGSADPVPATVGYDGTSDKAALDPVADLAQGATYAARVGTASTDGAGNALDADPDTPGDQPKTWSFRVTDVENPTVTLTNPGQQAEIGTSMQVEANASDNLGVARVEFFVDGLMRSTDSDAPYADTLDMGGYPHGSSHTVTARAVDDAGNEASSAGANVTLDSEVSLTLGGSPAQDGFTNAAPAPLQFTTDPDVPEAGRECRVVPNDYASCSSPYAPALTADGPYTYEVRVTDDAGNVATGSRAFTLDRTGPTLTVDNGPDGETYGPKTTQSWNFTSGDATSGPPEVRCSVVPAGATPAYGACSGASAHSVSNRPDGSYEFRVRATDGAGNRHELTRTFAIDASPPGVGIASGLEDLARTNLSSLTWNFSAREAGSTFECRNYPESLFPRPDFATCSGVDRHTVDGLSPGNYVFEVRARDVFGNVDGRPHTRRYAVDTEGPRVTHSSPANSARVRPSAMVSAVFSEGIKADTINRVTFKLTRGGRPVGASVTLDPLTNRATLDPIKPLARGATYRVAVTTGARDLADNPLVSTKSWSFKVG